MNAIHMLANRKPKIGQIHQSYLIPSWESDFPSPWSHRKTKPEVPEPVQFEDEDIPSVQLVSPKVIGS